jgi:hypothetical protein
MADEHAVEPPPGTPGQRALGAMESAVRRAREASGRSPLPPSEHASQPTEVMAPPTRPVARHVDPAPPTEEVRPVGDVRLIAGAQPLGNDRRRQATRPEPDPRPAARPNRWLIGSVAVVAALVVAAAIALIVSLRGATPTSTTAAGSTHTSTPASGIPSTSASGGATHPTTSTTATATTAPSSSTSTTAAVAPGGPPSIASLSPSSGTAGQSITVTGTKFVSSSGQIVATFNGQVAPTSCPAPNSCTLTAPPSTSPSAQVVITTSGGTSNAVTFIYN